MLYLNSLENSALSNPDNRFAICRNTTKDMPTIPELAPTEPLYTLWQDKSIAWTEFKDRYLHEMRKEFTNKLSQLKKIAEYSLKNDVTLHSPEPNGHKTYRSLLGEIIDGIWQKNQQTGQIIDLALAPAVESQHSPENQKLMQTIAEKCDYFSAVKHWSGGPVSCEGCYYLDQQVLVCPPTNRVVVNYQWV